MEFDDNSSQCLLPPSMKTVHAWQTLCQSFLYLNNQQPTKKRCGYRNWKGNLRKSPLSLIFWAHITHRRSTRLMLVFQNGAKNLPLRRYRNHVCIIGPLRNFQLLSPSQKVFVWGALSIDLQKLRHNTWIPAFFWRASSEEFNQSANQYIFRLRPCEQ